MKQELWLSRDDTPHSAYNIHVGKPILRRESFWGVYRNYVASFGANEFHNLFPGNRLRKGRKKRIKRILIELEG